MASPTTNRSDETLATFPLPSFLDISQPMAPRKAGTAAKAKKNTLPASTEPEMAAPKTFIDGKALPPTPLSPRRSPPTRVKDSGRAVGVLTSSKDVHVASCLKSADERKSGGDGKGNGSCAAANKHHLYWIRLTPPTRSCWTEAAAKKALAIAKTYHFKHVSVLLVNGPTSTEPGPCIIRFLGGHGLEKANFPWLLASHAMDLIMKSKDWVQLGRYVSPQADVSPGKALVGMGLMMSNVAVIFTFYNLLMMYLDGEGLRSEAEELIGLLPEGY